MKSFASIDEFRKYIYETAEEAYEGKNLGPTKISQIHLSKPRWFLNRDRFGHREMVLFANSDISPAITDIVITAVRERLGLCGLSGLEIARGSDHYSDQVIFASTVRGRLDSEKVHQKAIYKQAFGVQSETEQKGFIIVTSKEELANHGSFGSASFRSGVIILNLGSTLLPDRQNLKKGTFSSLPPDKKRRMEEFVRNITLHLAGNLLGMFCGCEEISVPFLEQPRHKQEMCNMHSGDYCIKKNTCPKCYYFLETWWEAIRAKEQ